MKAVCDVIRVGKRVAWTNYGGILFLWKDTPCKKCKIKWKIELDKFHFGKERREIVNIWEREKKKKKIEMNFTSIFYCPTCTGGGNLMVDNDDSYLDDKKPYNYFCTKCKRHFKIEELEK